MKNIVHIKCIGADLTTLSNIEVYMTQDNLFFQYVPTVLSAEEMTFVVPIEDAMKLKKTPVKLQFAFQYADGTPDASRLAMCSVDELLKEAGYDPD